MMYCSSLLLPLLVVVWLGFGTPSLLVSCADTNSVRDLQANKERSVDVIFVIDESSSLGPEQSAVQANVETIFDSLDAQTGGNFKVGLVGFGKSLPPAPNNPRGDIRLLSTLTNDRAQFLLRLGDIVSFGGLEHGYDSVYQIATDTLDDGPLGFSKQRFSFCTIVFTDEPSNGDIRTALEVNAALANNNGIVLPFVDFNVPASVASYKAISFDQTTVYDVNNLLTDPKAILSEVLTRCVDEVILSPTGSPQPSGTVEPSGIPSFSVGPTSNPTDSPSASVPSDSPSVSVIPSKSPSFSPTTSIPTSKPSFVPSDVPSDLPSFMPSDSTRMVVTRKCGKVVYLCGLRKDMLMFSVNKKYKEKAALGHCNVGGNTKKAVFVEEVYPDCLHHDFAAHCPNGKVPGKTVFGVCDNAMDLECRCCNMVNFKTLFRFDHSSDDSKDDEHYRNESEDNSNSDEEDHHDGHSDDHHDDHSDDHDDHSDEDDHDDHSDEDDHDDYSGDDEHDDRHNNDKDDHDDHHNHGKGYYAYHESGWGNDGHDQKKKGWKDQGRKLTETDYSTWPDDKSTCGRKNKKPWR